MPKCDFNKAAKHRFIERLIRLTLPIDFLKKFLEFFILDPDVTLASCRLVPSLIAISRDLTEYLALNVSCAEVNISAIFKEAIIG